MSPNKGNPPASLSLTELLEIIPQLNMGKRLQSEKIDSTQSPSPATFPEECRKASQLTTRIGTNKHEYGIKLT
jgi:hypothetical protein